MTGAMSRTCCREAISGRFDRLRQELALHVSGELNLALNPQILLTFGVELRVADRRRCELTAADLEGQSLAWTHDG